MRITFDPEKRAATLAVRAVDFVDAAQVFDGRHHEWRDDRRDYGELRFVTVGHLNGRMVVVVWTPRGDARHIISMRKANEREQRQFRERLG